jgi:DNA primase
LSQEQVTELIKERADIVEVIGRVVPLKKGSGSWVGVCPFHAEKTGSFHVYEESPHYYCFGCQATGDIFSFYQLYYHLDFMEARERLAQEYGVDLAPGDSFGSGRKTQRLFEVNRAAARLWYGALKKEGNAGLEYLRGRGVNAQAIRAFGLGFADGSGRFLADALGGDKEQLAAAEEVGLLFRSGSRYTDKYVNRVMFPIINTMNRVVGFGGRDITGLEAGKKYINSAASPAFEKSKNLYGLNASKESIHDKKSAILVEGYMDAVSLYMHGVTNAVAQLGTAFTPQQAKLLSRHTPAVALALDSDDAGMAAAEKSMDILREAGLKVRVLTLKGAKDPDEYIRKYGREAFEDAVRNAAPMYEFKLERVRGRYDLSESEGLTDYVKAAALIIAEMSPVDADYYTKMVSRDSGISEEAIRMETERGKGSGEARGARSPRRPARSDSADDMLRKNILGLALLSGAYLDRAVEYRHIFDGSDYAPILSAMLMLRAETNGEFDRAKLGDLLEDEARSLLDGIGGDWIGIPADELDRAFAQYMIRVEMSMLTDRQRDIMGAADLTRTEMDSEILTELKDIQRRISQLKEAIRSN